MTTTTDRVTVLVPAHDEEVSLPRTLASVAAQTVRPGRVLVVADNCTDGTEQIARWYGADVFTTRDNTDRKAGALDQALRTVDTEHVLVLDADTTIVETFVAQGLALLDGDPRLGAAGGVFVGESPRGYLQRCQANEYERYGAQIDVTGRTAVLTGTAALIRLSALEHVAAERGRRLPGRPGDVYDRDAITEDSELTLALRTLGYGLASPSSMRCTTELMPTWRDLHRQRVRWYKGMLDNLAAYGFTRTTARYHGQQLMLGIGATILTTLLALTLLAVVTGTFQVLPFWLGVGAVLVAERVVTAWGAGPHGRLLAIAVLPEIFYDLALQRAFAHAVWLRLAGRAASWNHVSVTAPVRRTESQVVGPEGLEPPTSTV